MRASRNKGRCCRPLSWSAFAMGIGSIIGGWIRTRRVVLPEYVGAMIVAAIVRNVDDRRTLVRISQRHTDMVGNIALASSS